MKACVKTNEGISNVFNCPIGLRQGCSLSPVLFALFINELYTLLCNQGVRGIQLFPDLVEIFILMFADDIALISDTIIGLQRQLNILSQFCQTSKLTVNIDKTKILVFKNGGGLSRNEKKYFNGNELECVNGFNYVGIYFSNRLSLYKMADSMAVKAKKVLVYILNSFKDIDCLPYKMFFKVFDSKISSILLYGSEIWGMKSPQCIEQLHIYACKRFLKVNVNACNDAILGDLGRYPLYINAHKRCIKYWLRLLQLPRERYSRLSYEMLLYYHNTGHDNWVTDIKNNLYSNGFGYIWDAQSVENPKLFLSQYMQCVKDQYQQLWHANCTENCKLNYYSSFKSVLSVEKYVLCIDIDKFRRCLGNFRSSAHSLMVEKGRHYGLDREHRICPYCESLQEDEFHLLLVCPLYSELRSKYLPKYYTTHVNVEKFTNLMSTVNVNLTRNLAMYIYYAFKKRNDFLEGTE